MKQVIFAIALLAMASLTGCLNGDDDSSVDDTTDDTTSDTTEDNTDTTQDDTDTTDDTKDDELIDPVGGNGGYTPPETANVTVYAEGDSSVWVSKNSHQIQTSCILGAKTGSTSKVLIYDSDDRVIFIAYSQYVEGAYDDNRCSDGLRIDITLGPEPAKVEFDGGQSEFRSWIVTF